jgi:hypothetical protein
MLDGVSTNGTSIPIVQLGDSGGVETTGYTATSTGLGGTLATTDFSSGFGVGGDAHVATRSLSGQLIISLLSANTWVASGALRRASAEAVHSAGSKTLSATLDRVRITTVNGTDTFDAGTINVMYE